MGKAEDRYAARGVSATKTAVHAATKEMNKGLFPGAFCLAYPDLALDPRYCTLTHVDGPGTKAVLAYLMSMENKDSPELLARIWAGIARDAMVMNLDDLGCVGALGPYYVSNSINRNYAIRKDGSRVFPDEWLNYLIDGLDSFCNQMTKWGFVMGDVQTMLTGGETADVGNAVRTLSMDVFMTTRMLRQNFIDISARMKPGDLIVGFSSIGHADYESYEDEPNSGIGANGQTSAQHELLSFHYKVFTEAYAPETDPNLIFAGKHQLSDTFELVKSQGITYLTTIGEALLSPTRTYMPLIRELVTQMSPEELHGLIHCTGGGQTKIGKFGKGLRIVKGGGYHRVFEVPPVFRLIQKANDTSTEEMYRTYNMGWRLEAVVNNEVSAMEAMGMAIRMGIDARLVGHVEESGSGHNEVIIHTENGEVLKY